MSAPPEPKVVGKGLQAKSQSDLIGSNHPVAPFVGNALEWSSYVYDDGTTCGWQNPIRLQHLRGAVAERADLCLRSYEGLMREDAPHGKGVLVLGNGKGGGIQRAARGDRRGSSLSCLCQHLSCCQATQ